MHLTLNSLVIPSPFETFSRCFDLLFKENTYHALGASLSRIFLSIIISSLIGITLGVLGGIFKRVEWMLSPLILLIRALPTVAVVLLLIIYVSNKVSPIIIVSLVTVPLTYEASLTGIKEILKEYINPLRLEGQRTFRSITRVIIPLALPYLFVGLISSLGLAMKVEIMAEILVGDTRMKGLGILISGAQQNLDIVSIYAYIIIVLVIIAILEILIKSIRKRITQNQ